jgi:hypothetical protein
MSLVTSWIFFGTFVWSNEEDSITNFMGHDFAIIIMQNLFFIGLYGINMDVIHPLVLFRNVIYMPIRII